MAPLFELGSTNTQQISKFYWDNVIFQEAVGGCYVWYSFRNLTTALTRRQPPDLLSLDDLTT